MAPIENNVPAQNWRAKASNTKAEGPDPILEPEFYEAISIKRIIAYVIDFLICFAIGVVGAILASIIGVMSFGLLFGPLMAMLALVPVVYHTFLIGSEKSATFGMRFCGIKVYRLDGRRPEMLQAFIQTAVFLFTVPATSSLILIVSLFNTRRRCLHDMLAGTIVLNDLTKQEG